MRYLSHKIRLYPNYKARVYFNKCFGVSRFAYNWALAEVKKHYEETGKTLSGFDLSKRLTVAKKTEYPWMYEVSKWASQKAVYDLADAFKRFFNKKSKFPKYKKKGKCRDSFYLNSNAIRVENLGLKVSLLKKKIRMSQEIRFPGRILSVTISRRANQYFASFQVELPDSCVYPYTCENQDVLGIDLGIKDFAILSTGEKVKGSKALIANERKLKHLQRELSRKQKGSQNRTKARLRVAKQYLRVSNLREDFLHKLSTGLVRNYNTIVIEDLKVSNMVKNPKLSKSISDQGWYEFRRQLEYKTKLADQELIVADQFYPSSKLCSVCGFKNDKLELRDRKWVCSFCGTNHDRDLNAAQNLKQLALGYRDSINACGEKSSGILDTKLVSGKQEAQIGVNHG